MRGGSAACVEELQMPGTPTRQSAESAPQVQRWPSPSIPHSPFLYNPSVMMARSFLQPFQPCYELNGHPWITQSTTPSGGDNMVGSELPTVRVMALDNKGSGA